MELDQEIFKEAGLDKVDHYPKIGFLVRAFNGNEIYIDYTVLKEMLRVVENAD